MICSGDHQNPASAEEEKHHMAASRPPDGIDHDRRRFVEAVATTIVAAGTASLFPTNLTAAEDDAIRPFRINVPEDRLLDLRRRIAATRWPDKETVSDRSQGAQLEKLPEHGARGSVIVAAAQKTGEISLPVAITVFPDDVYRAPETWARRAYRNLIYFHEVDKGGHFAAWEQPELFSAELRAAFRPLRSAQ